MILPFMTHEEMISSYMRDKDILEKALDNTAREFGSRCRKSRTFPFTIMKEYRSSHGECNDYYLFLTADKRGDWNKPQFCIFCKYRTPEGIGGFFEAELIQTSPCTDKSTHRFDFLTPHFVRRYAERKMGDIMLPEKDVIREYLSKERGIITMSSATTEFIRPEGRYAGQEHMYVILLTKGAAVVQQNKPSRYTVYVTYLGEKQLKANQKNFYHNRNFIASALDPSRPLNKGKRYRISAAYNDEIQAEIVKENSIEAYTFFSLLCAKHLKKLKGLPYETLDSLENEPKLKIELEEGLSEDGTVWTSTDGITVTIESIE